MVYFGVENVGEAMFRRFMKKQISIYALVAKMDRVSGARLRGDSLREFLPRGARHRNALRCAPSEIGVEAFVEKRRVWNVLTKNIDFPNNAYPNLSRSRGLQARV